MDNIEKIVTNFLNDYKDDFMTLVEQYVIACLEENDKHCDFFVDIGSMMNGTWHLSHIKQFNNVQEFKEFDWYELLNIDPDVIAEDDLLNILKTCYKIGYLWLIEQLTLLKQKNTKIEIRLCHNGTNEYQQLS
ncbi:hypothetical protein ACJJIK_12290 [Microbulbifer sp. ZKSA006]|uniref:hypothetical protein n=1 Tax=Microbulbifer sp. ZKSA006 TaxID=3243390 RepID=UPI0040396010